MTIPTSDKLPDIRTVALVLSPLMLISLLGLVFGSQIQRILSMIGLFFYQFPLWYVAWLDYQQTLNSNADEPDTPPPDALDMALWCLPLLLVTVYGFLFGNEMLVLFGAVILVVYITVVLYFHHLYRRYRALYPSIADTTVSTSVASAKKPNTVKLRPKGSVASSNNMNTNSIILMTVILGMIGLVIMLLPIIAIGMCFLQ